MVDEGKVEKEEKEGNDQADEAAEMGATKTRGEIQTIAGNDLQKVPLSFSLWCLMWTHLVKKAF